MPTKDDDKMQLLEIRLENLTKEFEREKKERVELEKEFHDWKKAKQEEEARRLRTALIAAGGVILTLGGFVWAEVVWPAIKMIRP